MRLIVVVVKLALLSAQLPSFRSSLIRSRPTKVRNRCLSTLAQRWLSDGDVAFNSVCVCFCLLVCVYQRNNA